ncbi:MAG: hypothetical protein ACLVJN_08045 [Streptococcus parasanguinis]
MIHIIQQIQSNPNDPNSPKYPATDQWKKDVTSTVQYVGAGSDSK